MKLFQIVELIVGVLWLLSPLSNNMAYLDWGSLVSQSLSHQRSDYIGFVMGTNFLIFLLYISSGKSLKTFQFFYLILSFFFFFVILGLFLVSSKFSYTCFSLKMISTIHFEKKLNLWKLHVFKGCSSVPE